MEDGSWELPTCGFLKARRGLRSDLMLMMGITSTSTLTCLSDNFCLNVQCKSVAKYYVQGDCDFAVMMEMGERLGRALGAGC